MDIKKRQKALKAAYEELEKMLTSTLNSKEVDPEKRRAAASMYKLAAEDSKMLWNEILELEGKVIVDLKDHKEIIKHREAKSKEKSGGLSPEARTNV